MAAFIKCVHARIAWIQTMTRFKVPGTSAHATMLEEAVEAIVAAIRSCRAITIEMATHAKDLLQEWLPEEHMNKVKQEFLPKLTNRGWG